MPLTPQPPSTPVKSKAEHIEPNLQRSKAEDGDFDVLDEQDFEFGGLFGATTEPEDSSFFATGHEGLLQY